MSFGFQKQPKRPPSVTFSGAKTLKNVSGEGFLKVLGAAGGFLEGFSKFPGAAEDF